MESSQPVADGLPVHVQLLGYGLAVPHVQQPGAQGFLQHLS